MAQLQQLVDQLNQAGGAWKIVGTGAPTEETLTGTFTDVTQPGAPPTVTTRGTGRYYVVVQDAEGHQRALFLKAEPIKGGLVVPQTGVTDQKDPTTGQLPKNVYFGDLTNVGWSQAGPLADVPAGPTTPTPSAGLDKLDAQGNVIPPGGTAPPVKLRDPKTGAVIDIPKDPQGTVVTLGDTIWIVKPDGTYTQGPTKPKEKTQFNVPGVGLVDYDPATGTATTLIASPKDPAKEVFEVRNGKTFRWDTTKGEWVDTNLPEQTKAATVYNDPNSPYLVWYDEQGKEVARQNKPGYVAPKAEPITADAVSQFVPRLDPTTNKIVWDANQNQVKASQAVSDIARSLGVQVTAGSMSEKQAQDVIAAAVNSMNAQTTQTSAATNAAQTALSAIQNAAQTGAGLLQNRVSAGQGMLSSVLGLAGQRPMVGLPAGTGQALMSDIQGFATQLGGGQHVYDTAARLVQAADPQGGVSPMARQAFGLLTQVFDRYQQQYNQPHPAVAATAAAQASAQQNAMVSPLTTTNPAGPSPNQISGFNTYGPVMGTPGVGGPNAYAVQPVAPVGAFVAPLTTNNLANTDPRLRGAIY